MPSAHYQPLEVHGADDDHDEEHIRSSSHYYHSRYHPHLAEEGEELPSTQSMTPFWGRGRGRCWLTMMALAFSILIIYFMFSPQSLGGDALDPEDFYEPHNGIAPNFKQAYKYGRYPPIIYGVDAHAPTEPLLICSENHEDRRLYIQDKPRHVYEQLPVIYFVTPTYPRREQIPELKRLAYTLLHVPRLHWLVSNDQAKCNPFLDILLTEFGIPYTHMASPMPSKFRKTKPAPRGVANRRTALKWLQQHNLTNGVLYFGDDDNTYDLRLFSEIRHTQRVSMFPVGLIAEYAVSGPVVRGGKVVGFLDSWVAGRRWPVDMAGFAVNLAYMSQYPNVNMPYKPGYEEDLFLHSIDLRIDQIEPRGKNCSEILVWHTQTRSKPAPVVGLESQYLDDRSNLGALFQLLKRMGVATTSDTKSPAAIISKNGKPKPHAYFLS